MSITDESPAVVEIEGEVRRIEKRRPGRPKGATTKNRIATVERINQEVDPIGWQARALKRRKVKVGKEWVPLTTDQQITLAQGLGRKVLPDLKATEVTGADGGPVRVVDLLPLETT